MVTQRRLGIAARMFVLAWFTAMFVTLPFDMRISGAIALITVCALGLTAGAALFLIGVMWVISPDTL